MSYQTSILENYVFVDEGYTILGQMTSSPHKMKWKDSTVYWYVDDIKMLNQVKKEWTFTSAAVDTVKKSRHHILICREGREIDYFNHAIDLSQGKTKQYLDQGKFKNAIFKTVSFNTLTSARAYLDRILLDENLLCVDNPHLLNFEGSFNFEYNCLDGPFGNCLDYSEETIAFLTEKISREYPNETFELKNNGGTKFEMFVQIKCNYSLSEKFDLYYRVNNVKWVPYLLQLHAFWKE
ncbi:MAG: hypothetical protein AB8G15_08805 [Saprospiraceae bacterium]